MAPIISRGLHGRRGDAPDDRVPPGQHVTRTSPSSPPVQFRTRRSSAGPSRSSARWTSRVAGRRRVPRAADRGSHPRYPLRDQMVEAGHRLVGRVRRHAARRARDRRRARRPALRRRLHHQLVLEDVTGGRAWSPSATTASRSSPNTAARRACSSPTSTSKRAPSGCEGLRLTATDEPGFWRSTATGTTAIHGASSGSHALPALRHRPRDDRQRGHARVHRLRGVRTLQVTV
jgi:hypothetical protein